jgi:hypothetical protein
MSKLLLLIEDDSHRATVVDKALFNSREESFIARAGKPMFTGTNPNDHAGSGGH